MTQTPTVTEMQRKLPSPTELQQPAKRARSETYQPHSDDLDKAANMSRMAIQQSSETPTQNIPPWASLLQQLRNDGILTAGPRPGPSTVEALTTGSAVPHQQEDDDDDDSPMAVTIPAVNTTMETATETEDDDDADSPTAVTIPAVNTTMETATETEDDDDADSPTAVTIQAVDIAMETVGIVAVARPGSSAVTPPTTESAVGGDGIRKRRRGSDDEGAEEHSSTAPIAGVPEAVVPVKKKRKKAKYRGKRPGRTNHRTRTKEARNLNNLH
jgi:hypothetical protein